MVETCIGTPCQADLIQRSAHNDAAPPGHPHAGLCLPWSQKMTVIMLGMARAHLSSAKAGSDSMKLILL